LVSAGLAEPAESLFPKDAPYCGAHLTPRPDYDFEKAKLLNCPEPEKVEEVTKEKKELSTAAIVAIAALGVAVLVGGVGLVVMYRREKAGDPIFQPLNSDSPDSHL